MDQEMQKVVKDLKQEIRLAVWLALTGWAMSLALRMFLFMLIGHA